MTASDVIDAEGSFAASSLLSSAEQTASAKLADALSQELAEEGEAASVSVAAAFVGAMVGGEAAVAALAGGAGVVAAAAAGVAAGEAAAAATTAAIASGPMAPIAVAVFAVPMILTAVWGASGGDGCCGAPPDPRPITLLGRQTETKAQALARAIATAKAANADSSCNGNATWESLMGTYATPPKGSFEEYAYAMIRGAIDKADLWRCWPLATVNFTKILALAIDSWNATHFGPTASVPIMLGRVPHSSGAPTTDPLTYAVSQAVPADGSKTIPTGQTSGFTQEEIPTWGGQTFKVVTLKVNRGAAIPADIHLQPIKMAPPAAQPSPSLPLHAPSLHLPSPSRTTPAAAPERMTVDLALILGTVGVAVAGPIGGAVGVGLGAIAGHFVERPS